MHSTRRAYVDVAAAAAAMIAYAVCTWADYAVSGSTNKAVGK